MAVLSTLLAITALAPFALWAGSLALTLVLGKMAGCVIHAGHVNPCVVFGLDVGGLAYNAGIMSAWGLLMAMPAFLVAGFLWCGVQWLRRNHW